MKTMTGHLTAGNKKAIQAIINAGLKDGRVGRTEYHITQDENIYTVKIKSIDRGLIPCAGSQKRLTTKTHTFTM